MIRWLFWKLFGCWRQCHWETIQRHELVRKGKDVPYGTAVDQRCTTCGHERTINLT
jgi:hypothetical protein